MEKEVIYLTPTKLAARWHITPHTLGQWRWTGRGPRFSKMGKRILYKLENIEKFEAQMECDNTSYLSLNEEEID
jgi:hypothetical protein